MQDAQKNLERDIPADLQPLSDEDIGAWCRYFSEERGQLHRSIQDSISQGVNREAKLTKGFVNEPYSQDSPASSVPVFSLVSSKRYIILGEFRLRG